MAAVEWFRKKGQPVPANAGHVRAIYLRAKAGTDMTDSSGDIRQAQRQPGHKSLRMTEHYVRK